MLGINQIRKFLAIIFIGFGFSTFAQGNTEISGHFGMKLGSKLNLNEVVQDEEDWGVDQKNRPWHFGADVLYRQTTNSSSFGIGVRYRFAFTGQKDFEGIKVGTRDENNDDDKYELTHHRIGLLVNYRFGIDHFFIGPVVGIDVWKYLKYTDTSGDEINELRSHQFLWNQISGQLGLEVGYKITKNLLVKLEGGYDLSGFSDLKCKTGDGDLEDCDDDVLEPKGTGEDADQTKTLKLSGFYATLGIGLFFG